MSASFKIACDVARSNSRRRGNTWSVIRDDFGFNVMEAADYVPDRAIAAYRKGRKINVDMLVKRTMP